MLGNDLSSGPQEKPEPQTPNDFDEDSVVTQGAVGERSGKTFAQAGRQRRPFLTHLAFEVVDRQVLLPFPQRVPKDGKLERSNRIRVGSIDRVLAGKDFSGLVRAQVWIEHKSNLRLTHPARLRGWGG